MDRNILKITIAVLALAVATKAYKNGAPTGVCESLTPQHGVDPQTSEFPYSLTTVPKGSQIAITIKTKSPTDSFKGFILQVRDNSGKPIGAFNLATDSKFVDCAPGKKNSLTHNSSKDKKEIKALWTAPANFKGSVNAIVTVARNGEEFWVGQKSSNIILGAARHRH